MMRRGLQVGIVASALSSDPRQAIALSQASGFAGIAFDTFAAAFEITQLSQSGRREFGQLLRSNDQQLVALRVELGPKGIVPGADIDRLLSQIQKVMEVANGLQTSPLVCLDVGPLPEPAAESKPTPHITPEQAGVIIIPNLKPAPAPQESRPVLGPDPAQIAHADNALAALCALADRMSVTLALRSDLASFAALDRAIRASACPWLAIDLDPVAILRDAWPPDEIFSRLGPLVRHVLARDATVGADKRTKPTVVGKGSTEWRQLLANLDAAGFSGWITLDPTELSDRRAAALAGAKFLREASLD